jgi:acetyl esterase/lipase
MEDAKTAVRFMRKHAKEYKVNTDKVAIFGGSSGGHTALMAGFTGDGQPDTDLYGDFSAEVGCIIDWFGPTSMEHMNTYPSGMDHTKPDSPEGKLIGGKYVYDNLDLAAAASPINYISEDKPTPPVLIMHGDRDFLVPLIRVSCCMKIA